MTLCEENIHMISKTIDSNVEWSIYSKVIDSKEMILLMYGTLLYTVIPKRVFKDDNELKSLMELVTRKIGNKQK